MHSVVENVWNPRALLALSLSDLSGSLCRGGVWTQTLLKESFRLWELRLSD